MSRREGESDKGRKGGKRELTFVSSSRPLLPTPNLNLPALSSSFSSPTAFYFPALRTLTSIVNPTVALCSNITAFQSSPSSGISASPIEKTSALVFLRYSNVFWSRRTREGASQLGLGRRKEGSERRKSGPTSREF